MGKDINKKISELEAKIEELKKLDSKTKTLRTLDSYTMAEKIEKFNEFFKTASDTMQSKIDGEYHEDNDDAHYAWEAIMNLLGKDVWDVWNKLPNSYDRDR
jgi:hypothetical protein